MWILAFFGYLSQVNGDVIVNLANGQVRGIQSVTDTCNTDVCSTEHPYYAFKGMRYAQPPERFKRSVAVKPWTGIYDATSDGASCIQVPRSNLKESEDCLFINVYTPTLPSDSNISLAVMVWIYGGTFIFGDSNYATYGPDHFLLENVIIVSLNYRLGLFGFMSTGNDLLPGNDGIKDLVLGLQWIKENIHAFNGDPNNILLFGESAGAALISYLIQSPLTRNLGLEKVAHGGELNYFWKNSFTTSTKFSSNDLLTRRRLIRLWTNFAKYGNPTPVLDTILQNITWPTASLGRTNINCDPSHTKTDTKGRWFNSEKPTKNCGSC
ncbi:PREDICTED: esterase FE4-like [Nicrophorus vespilloides]|uniref:Esterase FE4-like n=1 Tax=Nicrophorus vespilloides TaxID=110193 RepID=A0ABM1MBW0_NICVS|nr:PREDICTED: esterase FE4-like [Nicrophorus vespilloides]